MFNKQHEMCLTLMPHQNVYETSIFFLVYMSVGFGLGSLSVVVCASPLFE